jgi:hypothetical protein
MIGPGFASSAAAEMGKGRILPFIALILALLFVGGMAGYFVAEHFL